MAIDLKQQFIDSFKKEDGSIEMKMNDRFIAQRPFIIARTLSNPLAFHSFFAHPANGPQQNAEKEPKRTPRGPNK